jgi:hypothetical protein
MKVEITIEMDNAAFDGADAGAELARILRKFADTLQDVSRKDLPKFAGLRARDVNGNTVGKIRFTLPEY